MFDLKQGFLLYSFLDQIELERMMDPAGKEKRTERRPGDDSFGL